MLRPLVVLLILANALQAFGLKSSNCTFQRQPIAAPGTKNHGTSRQKLFTLLVSI
jgi:hypothetical protein